MTSAMQEVPICPSNRHGRFIRNQNWCECERSCNVSTGNLEIGLSVYECRPVSDGVWEPIGCGFEVRAKKFPGQERKLLDGLDPWYLLSGQVVGTGSDGEPLIRSVAVHSTLRWDGSRYFNEIFPCNSIEHGNHPNHPECTCTTIDDYLKETDSIDIDGDEAVEMNDAYDLLKLHESAEATMSKSSVRVWEVETRDGDIVKIQLPSFRQVILSPNGSHGAPVPLDGNAIKIKTAAGQVSLSDPYIKSGERLNDNFRFTTATDKYVGQLIMTAISRLVVVGIVDNNPSVIDFDQILRITTK